MKKRVVITGIGPVTSVGNGKTQFWESLLNKRTNIVKLKDEDSEHKYKTQYKVPCAEFSIEAFPELKKMKNKASVGSIMCVYSSLLSLEDAKISKEAISKRCSVIIGTGFGNSQNAVDFTKSFIEFEQFNRMTIPIAMPNALAAWISIVLGTHGSTYTINTACASGSDAVGHAYEEIAQGKSDMCICGGVDIIKDELDISFKGFDSLTVLTKSKDGYPKTFSEERSGFLFNEGAACTLVLEELEHALNRNAEIYAELSGYSCNSDAYNIVMMQSDGKYEKVVVEELKNKVKSIDYYNAHGTGTILNDKMEANIIQELFGNKESQPIISSTKGLIGHSIGASGAIEAAVCALSIKYGKIHGNILGTSIGNLNIHDQVISKKIDAAISASFGFGGHNAALLFTRYISEDI